MNSRRLRSTRSLFFCLIGCTFMACSQVMVSQDYDRGFDFQAAKTYAWKDNNNAPNDDLLQDNDLLRRRFMDFIADNLEQKGFSQSNNPAYLISCSYKVVSKLDTTPYNSGVSFGLSRYGQYSALGVDSGSYIEQYDQGQLTVNFYSAHSKRLIWTGFATRQVRQHYTPQQYDALANEMSTAVIAQFPPQSEE